MMEEEKKKTVKKGLHVNLVHCKYDVVQQQTRAFGMKPTQDPHNWSLFWIDTGVSYERVLEMYRKVIRKTFQRINHFPGMHEICRKDQLARRVQRVVRMFPKDYTFFPQSWIMPQDWMEFQRQHKTKKSPCYISKPDHGCQGKGIFLFKDPQEIADRKKEEMVVQTYLGNPCLMDGYKFDFRVYVLVTSVNPLRIFVYDDGLARFATEPYHTPSDKNRDRVCMHLTNYAVNKHSKGFIRNEERGSKRTIQSVLEELEKTKGVNRDVVWKRIQDAVVKTVLMVQPQVQKLMKPWFPTEEGASLHHLGSQCFEILGFDILLDSKMKPWVLEVNHSPSFTCDSPLDLDIKSGVIQNALKLVNPTSSAQKKYQKDQKQKSLGRLFQPKSKPVEASNMERLKTPLLRREESDTTVVDTAEQDRYASLLQEYHRQYPPALLQKLTKWEDARCGKYERVFPPLDPTQLGKYLSLIQNTLESCTQTVKMRKQFQEAKKEQETVKMQKWEQWKQKQQRRVVPRVGMAKKEEWMQWKGTTSPTPTVVSRTSVRQKQPMLLKVQTLNDQFEALQSSALYTNPPTKPPTPITEYLDLMTTHPLITQKQFELERIHSYVNSRKRK
jgi:tubulin polyglutamylase TTLL6/13